MARIFEPTAEQVEGYAEFVRARPPVVAEVAARFEPWSLYRLKTTGQRVTIRSFGESVDGHVTVRILVSARYNFGFLDFEVFGVDPDDLEPCDVPPEQPSAPGSPIDHRFLI